MARERGFTDVARSGWPDFMVRNAANELIGVEVKRGADRLSKHQTRMFALLEEAGIRVFVWWSLKPTVLMPWRSFAGLKKEAKLETVQRIKRSLIAEGILPKEGP